MDLQFSRLPICVGDVTLKVAQGHFATSHSHINYLIDVTEQKSSLNEAMAVAQQLMERYLSKTMVDTILCLDGTRMIGACLAQKMTQAGYLSINEGRDVYVPQVEVDGEGRILFRDNTFPVRQGRRESPLPESRAAVWERTESPPHPAAAEANTKDSGVGERRGVREKSSKDPTSQGDAAPR